MTKWKKDAKEFTVGVNHNAVRGYQSSIPKPIIEYLKNPKKITFVIKRHSVLIVPIAKKSSSHLRGDVM